MIPGMNFVLNAWSFGLMLADELARATSSRPVEVVDAVTLPVLPLDPGARVVQLVPR